MHRPAWTEKLSDQEIEAVREAMLGTANGRYFPTWEFTSLIGLDRDEVRREAASWPETDNEEDQVCAAINSLVNLLGYPHQRGIRECVKSYPSKKLPQLLAKLDALAPNAEH